jgi:DNA-directed RNA polymerase specialized sigma24 family protein
MAEPVAKGGPVKLFYCYAHNDEPLRNKLQIHLSNLQHQQIIEGWHDRKIAAGSEWAGEIDEQINSARVVLLLVSSNFLASKYCYDVEMKRALERHEKGEARVIPVILRPCDWKGAPFGKLQALPKDAKPVTKWKSQDEAFLDVSSGIRRAVEELKAKPPPGAERTARPRGPRPRPGAPGKTQPPGGGGIKVVVEIEIEDGFYTSVEEARGRVLQGIAGSFTGLVVIGIRAGSILLTVEAEPAEADAFVRSVKAGSFRSIGVVDARVLGPSTPEAGGAPPVKLDKNQLDDESLFAYASMGDREAFDVLAFRFRFLKGLVRSWCVELNVPAHDSFTIAQNTVNEAVSEVKKSRRVPPTDSRPGWLEDLAKREFDRWVRSLYPDLLPPPDSGRAARTKPPEAEKTRELSEKQARKYLDWIVGDEREILERVLGEGQDYEEAGSEIPVPGREEAQLLLLRALRKLNNIINEYGSTKTQ